MNEGLRQARLAYRFPGMKDERRSRPRAGAARIAVLEDDPSQAKLLQHWIEGHGEICHLFSRGGDIMRAVLRETFDLVILDWQVPDLSGEEVLKAIRKSVREPLPVLFTTGRNREEDIVHALNHGADDYLVKPLRRLEFLARVSALLRRRRGGAPEDEPLEIGVFRIDVDGRSIEKDGVMVELTQKEFDVAALLFRNVGRLLSRTYLLDAVWGISADVSTRTVDTHVSQLRSKLGLYPEAGWRLSAVYQHGYRLERLAQPAPEPAAPAPARKARRKRA
jgi:two-component system, OmpR family, response regulator RegX3